MIDPISAGATAEALAALNAGMTGLSAAEAYDRYITDKYNVSSGAGIGYAKITEDKPAISGNTANTIPNSSTSDPVDAWTDYVETVNPNVSEVTGGTQYGSKVNTYIASLIEDNENVVKAVVPKAVAIDQAYIAIAQALGVSMDAAEMDVETKRAFANSIVSGSGMLYDEARDLVTAWWDGVNMLFPKSAIDAVSDTIEDLGIGQDSYTRATNPDYPDSYVCGYQSYTYETSAGQYVIELTPGSTPNDWCMAFTPDSGYPSGAKINFVAKGPGNTVHQKMTEKSSGRVLVDNYISINNSLTASGKTIYMAYSSVESGFDLQMSNVPEGGTWKDREFRIGDIYFYGTQTPVGGGYPEGTSRSQADSYTPSTIPSAGAVLGDSASDTIPVVPINLPTNPLDTTDSEVDPITPSNPDDVDTLPAPPIPLPIPDTNVSNPDVPLTNPSVVNTALIDQLVEDLANTLDPQPEQSSGLIPYPFMPGTPVDPDDPSAGSAYPSIVPASGSGLIHVYNPTPAEFVSFGNWLWVTYADATIDKIWNNPFDGIIGAFELYATPPTDGTDNIRSGFLVCPTTASLVRQRYSEIDCGTVIVPEFYGNYLDYSPYSQVYLYLPFIGINEVSVDDIVGHAVNIRYRFDAYNGSCIAMIYVAKNGYRNLAYQFAGNCAVEVPLAGGSQAAIKAGMMQAEAYARSTIQSAQIQKTASIGQGIVNGASASAAGPLAGILGALAGGTAGYISGQANAKAAELQAGATTEAARVANKSSVQHSGQFGASHGAMGLKIPHIMVRNPIQVKVVNYNDDYGFPAHKRVIIGGCTGYLRVREVNVISAHATNEEKRAIEAQLKAGVYIS